MSLTYEDNDTTPIAQILCPGDDRLVYISNETKQYEGQIGPDGREEVLHKVWDLDTINTIADAMNNGMNLKGIIDLFASVSVKEQKEPEYDGLEGDEIYLDEDECIEVLPTPRNERIIIGGQTGCGKSTWAATYARLWKKLHPDGMIHIFCRQGGDPAFAGIDHEEIVVDHDLISEVLGIHDFTDTLVIFDDMDNLQEKSVIEYIHKLMNDLMSCGRKQNIYVIYMTHIFKNRAKTQIPLLEASKIVFFNGAGDRGNIGVLKDYAQMNKKEIDRLIGLDSHWCCLERSRPRYLVHQKGIFLL